MARLDAAQRRLLALLSETEWRSAAAVFAETSLYRSPTSLAAVLGQLRTHGLVERRVTGTHSRRVSEWRLVAAQSEPRIPNPTGA